MSARTDDDTPTLDGTTGTADPAPTGAARRRRPHPAWIVAALGWLVAGVVGWQWLQLSGAEAERAAVQTATAAFVTELINWDATDGLEDTREALRAAGTEPFVGEVDELFGGTLGQELEQARAVSTGEIEDVFVQRLEGDEAVTFAVAVQELATGLTDEVDVTVRSARITLARVDGRWLVSRVDLVNDNVVPSAATAEPTAEPSPAAPAPSPAQEPSP